MNDLPMSLDPKLDLLLERRVDVPADLVWKAWTTPKHLLNWFTPAPWKTVECEMDLRPGGKFFTVMQSPEGQTFPNTGCYLEVVSGKRLVWTSALRAGYRPQSKSVLGDLHFTASVTIEADGDFTNYRAIVLHGDEESCRQHESMGFYDGWGAAFDQLVALVRTW
jgi:uncharacterized protein YndB with AHSA1/START domain